MKITTSLAIIGLFAFSGAAFAAATPPVVAPAPAVVKPAMSAVAPAAPMSDLAKKCSMEADAKGLHGKARKHFRSNCKKM